ARTFPGMGLAVKIVDLDGDGSNEIILGTGQEGAGTAIYYTFRIEDTQFNTLNISRPDFNKSAFTHNLAPYDIDGDGMLEVISAYCGYGEIIRYDYDLGLKEIKSRKIHQLSGSGEESIIADVDNDGFVEYITSNGFRKEDAKVEIFEFDNEGELIVPPRLVIDGYDGKRCFYASFIIGDVDNDNKNEIVIGWKQDQQINRGTILGYQVGEEAEKKYTFAYEDKDLDLSYFEKMMVIADADNDGLNELLVSTRGDNLSERIKSEHLGHLFMWTVSNKGIDRELLVNLHEGIAGSSWIAVGDADNDGLNEIILATGQGDRTQKGISYVLMVER
ncbi:MAG: VCBS repeat-containing protein, partial [Bacteroidales bacterium]|nr:VCBS repeat-containing protein [Bacteroidales bacterium]